MTSISNLVFLLHIILIFNTINCKKLKNQVLFKCQHDNEQEHELLPNRIAENSVNQNEYIKRRMVDDTDTDEFRFFNIYLDLENIKHEIVELGLQNYQDFFISSMQKAVSVLQTLLKVKPLLMDYCLYDDDFSQLNIKYWNHEKFGTEACRNGFHFRNQSIDLVIFGQFYNLPESTLATASAKATQKNETRNGQPYVGLVKINKNVNYILRNSEAYFQTILVHEFTHILGFSKSFFTDYYKNIYSKIDKHGIMRSYLNSPKLLKVAREYFDCPTLEGVELENQGGNGTEGSHWEARILLGEYMNGYSYTEEQVISEFTLAVLEDSGYYQANYYTGGLMRYGKHKGCAFLEERCIDLTTHKTNSSFENEFYDTINERKSVEATCTSGRQSRTYKAWWEIPDVPDEYLYFANPNISGYPPADYCPVFLKYQEEEDTSYYSGHCSTKGAGIYGSILQYPSYSFNGTSAALQEKTGETLSDHSFCFLSSLAKKTFVESQFISLIVRANCYEIKCSNRSLTVKLFDDYFVCPREGGKIQVEGYEGYLLCPDYNLLCSGTVICNDIFDCIEKKSEIKADANTYDYEIKTTQDVNKYIPFSNTNYELSENGYCPKNCKYCKEEGNCITCRDDYGLIELDGKLKCESIEYLSVSGYFKNETTNTYEKCMDNCLSCFDKITCSGCKEGHMYIKGTVNMCKKADDPSKLISNCLEYDNNQQCSRCNAYYGFKGNNRSICYSIYNELSTYYTKDDGISYYSCSTENSKCEKCLYDHNTSLVNCTKCANDLILIIAQRGICIEKKELINNTRYYIINETHAGSCSQTFNNCLACSNDEECSSCRYGFEFLKKENNKNNVSECVPKNIKSDLIKYNEIVKGTDEGEDEMKTGETGTETKTEKENEKSTESETEYIGPRRRKKNNSHYFSIVNILSLQFIYILFLLIKF